MKTYLCGIRYFLRAAGHTFPSDHPPIRMLLRGIGRSDHPHRQRAPAFLTILEACGATVDLAHQRTKHSGGGGSVFVVHLPFAAVGNHGHYKDHIPMDRAQRGDIRETNDDCAPTADSTAAAAV
ncbi:hypothetical protein GQ600_18621 [Phytophthora cactorum]|nr:hypothetical protein GQ600_18621 [Phytophthora cactorum]